LTTGGAGRAAKVDGMTEPTLSDQARAAGSAVATGAAVVGVGVASALDNGVAAGEAVGGTIALLTFFSAPAVSIVALLWWMAPGDPRLSRGDRVRVNRAIRLGAALDDPRLAPSVVHRADKVAQRLERARRNLEGRLGQLVVVLMVVWAVNRVLAGDLWQAGAIVVLAAVVAWQRPYWAAARERQRDRALTAGVAVIKLRGPAT
jgi:hypothetical protein